MKLTQQDMARLLKVTPMTLRNWRRDKPFLYEILQKGFAFDEIVEAQKESYEKALELQEKFKTNR
ncbi:MAG: hypothetical protein PHI38_07495 [Sulfurimonas sp.]|jgi:transcriptional regulator with XRE-family HTH domain|uniref:hypothetical protein n=1 Tax=Sulfurimonas sp. TaxID=2022749 RepID=UPI0026394CD1|nr:hypothetical protein [Sulfurimonas sp.]MDD3476697.1 hypothetical protein [Sulfurimonas sp.]